MKKLEKLHGTGEQKFETEEGVKWRVWSIDKKNGTVEIISEKQTTDSITIAGANGYNHAVDIINDMCKALYSNGKATARSMNIEDINSKTTYDPTNDESYPNYGKQPNKYTDGKYPSIYDVELGSTSDMLTDTEETKKLLRRSQGVRKSDGSADYTTYQGTGSREEFKPTETYYNYSIEKYLRNDLGENNIEISLVKTGARYWLASRCIHLDSTSYARFELIGLSNGGSISRYDLLHSDGWPCSSSNPVRPIVSLPDSTTWLLAEQDGTQTWNITL